MFDGYLGICLSNCTTLLLKIGGYFENAILKDFSASSNNIFTTPVIKLFKKSYFAGQVLVEVLTKFEKFLR